MRLPAGLPKLNGRWLAAYRLLWWAMLATTLGALTIGQWRDMQWATNIDRQVFGAGLRSNSQGDRLTFGPVSPAARAAGIAPESVLLTVDGRAVSSEASAANLERIAQMLDGRDGRMLRLRLRAPDGASYDARTVRGPEHMAAADREAPVPYRWRTVIAYGSQTIDALILIVGAVLLFRRRKSDPVVALLSFGLLSVPANQIAILFSNPVVREATDNAFAVIPIICILTGMTVFPAGRFSPRWSLLIVPAIAAWIAVVVVMGNQAPVPLQVGVAVPALIVTIGSLAARFRRMTEGPQRQQVKWVMLGFAAFVACGLLQAALVVIDDALTDNRTHFALLVAINLLTAAQGLCLVGGLLVSLLRHRLYDADAAISRSALYAALTVLMVAIFAGIEKLLETLAQEWFGNSGGAVSGAIAAALAALLLVPLHHRMSRWAERRFQRDLARLRAALPELLAEMRDSESPRELADDALRLALHGVRAKHGAILLAENGAWALAGIEGMPPEGILEGIVAELPTAPEPGLVQTRHREFPLRLPLVTPSGAHPGWLLVGPHPDGSFYGKDDREALEEVASPLARTLWLVIERARREAEREEERQRFAERIAALERAIARLAPLRARRRKPAA